MKSVSAYQHRATIGYLRLVIAAIVFVGMIMTIRMGQRNRYAVIVYNRDHPPSERFELDASGGASWTAGLPLGWLVYSAVNLIRRPQGNDSQNQPEVPSSKYKAAMLCWVAITCGVSACVCLLRCVMATGPNESSRYVFMARHPNVPVPASLPLNPYANVSTDLSFVLFCILGLAGACCLIAAFANMASATAD